MKILITGATGFIGGYLVKELAKNNDYHLVCLVRNQQKAEQLKPLGVKLMYVDTSKEHTLAKLLRESIDVIFHCSGYVGRNKELLYSANVLSTENICRLGLNLNVDRFIYLSSVSVISGNSVVPLKENLPYKATDVYGESKIQAEKKVLEFRNKGLKAVILRPCMVYGEGEPHLLGRLSFLIKHRLLPMIDGGEKKLHLVYVKNVVEAMIYSLQKQSFLNGSFLIADGEVLTIQEIFKIIADTLGVKPPWNISGFVKPILLKTPYLGRRLKFFLKDRVYSIDRVKSLGFRPTYKTKDSLMKSVESFMK